MKHIRYLSFFAILALFTTLVFVQNDSLSASGKIDINSAEDLAKIGNDPDYPLDGDYLLTTSSDLRYHNNGHWEPIGDEDNPFTGTFDGGGHWLDYLKINQPGDSYLGLFGHVKAATIENLELRNVNIKGDSYVGALFGRVSSEQGYNIIDNFVNNVHVEGNVSGDHYVGGVIGRTSNASIKNVASDVDVEASYLLGGLAGGAWGSSITSSYSHGDVIATSSPDNTRAGGLVGDFTAGSRATIETSYAVGKIEGINSVGGLVGQLGEGPGGDGPFIINSYAAGRVTGEEKIGGLVGSYSNPSSPPIEASNSYYDKDIIGQNYTGEGEGKSTSDMLKEATYDGWDFTNTWGINSGEYPHLRALSNSGPRNLRDIVSIEAIDPIEVEAGTPFGEIPVPHVFANLYNGETEEIFVQSWIEEAEPYDKDVPGDYAYESLSLSLGEGMTNSQGHKAYMTITVLPPEITSVEDLVDITVDLGTDYDNIGLPDQVEVDLKNGSTLSLDVDWDQGDPNYDGETPDEYTFTGTLDVPADVTNPDNLDAHVKVTVSPLEITSVADLANITVDFGTNYNDIGLPDQVEVKLDNDDTRSLDVDWDQGDPNYDGETPDEYTFTGTLDVPADVTNPNNLAAQVKVTVLPLEITGVEDLSNIEVGVGADITDLDFPNEVEVTLDDGSAKNLSVNWDQGDPNYDGETPGEYTFTGTLNVPSDVINPNNLAAQVKVTVLPLEITAVEDLTDINVVLGTDLANIGLPSQVKVDLSDGSTRNLPVTWDHGYPTFDENIPGEYIFTGSLDMPTGVVNLEFFSATVKVIVTPEQEINIPLDTETNIYAGQKGIIGGSEDFLIIPEDLPHGTTIIITDVRESKKVENAEGIEPAGTVYHFEFNYPVDSTFVEDFTLTLVYDQDVSTDVDIYYYNENDNEWEAQNGSIDPTTQAISISPSHFSVYGVFALLEEDEEDPDDGENDDLDNRDGSDNGENNDQDNGDESDSGDGKEEGDLDNGEDNEDLKGKDPKGGKNETDRNDFSNDDITIVEDPEDKDTDGDILPKTATSNYMWIAAGLILLLLSAITWIWMRRRLN